MGKTKEETTKAIVRYKKDHYKRVVLDLKPEVKERWVLVAKLQGKSLQGFVTDCVEAEIERIKNGKASR